MTVLIDSRPHAEVVKAAVSAELGSWSAFDYDEVPGGNTNAGTPPKMFAVVAIERTFGPLTRMSGQAGVTGWRVPVRAVGSTVDECRWVLSRIGAALNEAVLTVEGVDTTRITFESDTAPAWDDGTYSAEVTYTYSH